MRRQPHLTLRVGLLAVALLATACQRAATGPTPTGVAQLPAASVTASKLLLMPPKWKAFPRRSLLQVDPPRWPISTFAGPTSADLQCGTDPAYCVLPSGLDDGLARNARFRMINSMVTDTAGNAYLVDTYTCQVKRVAPDGTVRTLAGGYDGTGGFPVDGAGYDARFSLPWGIALGPDGNLYVTDRNAERIRRVSPTTGEVATVGDLIVNPELIAIDGAGNTYISTGNGIRKRSLAGAELDYINFRGDREPQDGQLYTPGVINGPLSALTADAEGNLYMACERHGSIRKLSPDRVVTTIAGATEQGYQDGPAADARFSRITGLVPDGAGGLFVADAQNNVVRHLSAGGMVTTVAGSGDYGYDDGPGDVADLAAWSQVLSIARDKCGNLLIAEPERIRQAVSPNPSQPQVACIPAPGGPLSLQYAAFSPDRPNANPDDNKDTNEIRIGAEPGEPWVLELVGNRVFQFQTGVGPTTIVWNGHNPRNPANILPDGNYSFLLARPDKPEQTVSMVIDTRKPQVSANLISVGGAPDDRRYTYTFNVACTDADPAPSGVDRASARVKRMNIGFEPASPSASQAPDQLSVSAIVEPSTKKNLWYAIEVSDLAGNTGVYRSDYTAQLSARAETLMQASSCTPTDSTGYRLQNVEVLLEFFYQLGQGYCMFPIHVEEDHKSYFYPNSGERFLYGLGYMLKSPSGETVDINLPESYRAHFNVQFENVTLNLPPGDANRIVFDEDYPLRQVKTEKSGGIRIAWDGLMDRTVQIAPMGDYKVRVAIREFELPGFAVSFPQHDLDGFKLVNYNDQLGGYNSFSTFKGRSQYGPAGNGLDWHHIVEKNKARGDGGPFDDTAVNHIANLIPLPRQVNQVTLRNMYTGRYDGTNGFPNTAGQTLRAWLRVQDFETNHRIGVDMMRKAGVKI